MQLKKLNTFITKLTQVYQYLVDSTSLVVKHYVKVKEDKCYLYVYVESPLVLTNSLNSASAEVANCMRLSLYEVLKVSDKTFKKIIMDKFDFVYAIDNGNPFFTSFGTIRIKIK